MNFLARTSLIVASALLAMIVVACGSNESDSAEVGAVASAEIKGPEGEAMGVVILTQGTRGVLVSANLRGLTPGYHGFHIHEAGNCEPDFSAAGDHFAPEGMGHGYMNQDGHHAGDLPNIHAAADGTAVADFFNSDITLQRGKSNSILDGAGTAIIVHEKADSYGAEAGAGGRVGCGVIR